MLYQAFAFVIHASSALHEVLCRTFNMQCIEFFETFSQVLPVDILKQSSAQAV